MIEISRRRGIVVPGLDFAPVMSWRTIPAKDPDEEGPNAGDCRELPTWAPCADL